MGISADRKIADSQADKEGAFDDHCQCPAESFHTDPTVVLPGGTQLAPRNLESNVSASRSPILSSLRGIFGGFCYTTHNNVLNTWHVVNLQGFRCGGVRGTVCHGFPTEA